MSANKIAAPALHRPPPFKGAFYAGWAGAILLSAIAVWGLRTQESPTRATVAPVPAVTPGAAVGPWHIPASRRGLAAELPMTNIAIVATEPSALEASLAREVQADPAGVAELALLLPPGKIQNEALASAVMTWARADPQTAAEWVALLPENHLRTLAVERLIPTWTASAMDAAARWIAELPAGGSRDAALRIFARIVADDDPDIALSLSDTIANGPQRNLSLERLGREWLRRDPEAAAAALVQTSLPEARRQALLAEQR